jgi:radical SAM superfamily enzyme YgiQ (UPF0313 family)
LKTYPTFYANKKLPFSLSRKKEDSPKELRTIYFADLSHTAQGVHSKCMPLGSGVVACYIKQQFSKFFEVDIFKFPKDLEQAFTKKVPDLLCLSVYAWNIRLTATFARFAKRINPNLIIIMGGPNFPYTEEAKHHFLSIYDHVDFYIFGEGELALSNLLEKIIHHNYDIAKMKALKEKEFNCSYLTNDKKEVVSGEWQRIDNLDDFPCPYTTGMMEKFFALPLIPMYETTRGCPFGCTFCTDGYSERSSIHRRSMENIDKSISYISSRAKYSDTLILADLNFGMYNQDVQTAEIIAKHKELTGFPITVGTALGKSRPENIMKAVNILKGSLHLGLSLQSTDTEILKHIKRKNLPTPKLISAAEDIGLRDSIDFTEVIVGLPGDTLEKHFDSLREGVDLGMTNIRMYQLMLLIGSEMESSDSRERFNFDTRWRVMPGCAGVYSFFGNEVGIAEIEEIVVANNTMTFEDYIECRVMDFMVEVFVNNDLYSEPFALIDLFGLKRFDVLLFARQRTDLYPEKVAAIFSSFIKDTCKDLFPNQQDIENYIASPGVLEKHVTGELGNNEILDHKALCFVHFPEVTAFIFEIFRNFLLSKGLLDDRVLAYLLELEKFLICRKNNLLKLDEIIVEDFNFDFQQISQAKFKIDPNQLPQSKTKLKFYHNEQQSSIISKASAIFGTSVSGLGRFIQNNRMHRMFRKFEAMSH